LVPNAPGASVDIERVSRSYRSGRHLVEALADVSLTVAPGSFATLLGPSGCGKSTLLNIIAGFDQPTSGNVVVDGMAVRGPSVERGVVFQDTGALFPWLTVAENVAFGLRAVGRPRREVRDRVAEALDLVRLSAFSQRHPHELSGGMRQLVAISRVLVMEPKLLLMDEPFAALDAITRQRLQNRLTEIWQRTRITIVFITHSVDEAILLADDVAVMTRRPGRVRTQLRVGLDRPRSVTSAQFNALKQQALNYLIPPEDKDDAL
jgi:ABC-type nitrate/sulfonate/bicarbonate transport system ATPase subunit